MKDESKKMPRAFCVLVFENSYNPYTEKSSGDYKNYRVLVGPGDCIDFCKKEMDEKFKGTFEIVVREQKI